MTLKKLFVVAAGVGAGVVVSLALLVAAWEWWEGRPQPRDTASVTAKYERPVIDKADDGSTVLQFRYRLTNNTDRSIVIMGSHSTMYIQRDDGSLIDLRELTETLHNDTSIPARESVVYFVSPQLGYRTHKDCAVEIVPDPEKEQLLEYVEKCYDWINGFVLMDEGGLYSNNLRIDMSFRPSTAIPRS